MSCLIKIGLQVCYFNLLTDNYLKENYLSWFLYWNYGKIFPMNSNNNKKGVFDIYRYLVELKDNSPHFTFPHSLIAIVGEK